MSRLRPPPPLKTIALLLNLGLFAMGLYFELHPRDREDAWSAAGVAAVALLNSAALTVRGRRGRGEPAGSTRLRRVATIANALILLVAAAIVVFEAVNDSSHALVHGAALVLPPLFTLLALAGQRRR